MPTITNAFRCACMFGHLEMARWLVALDPEIIVPRDLGPIKTWSKARTVWIRAAVSV
jgi:hypothetical protein